METLEVTCINKQDRQDPTQSITHLGGKDWHNTQQAVINAIENKTHRFYVERSHHDKVWLVVARSRHGNKYVKTEADGEAPNNLLNLRECNR